MLNLSPRAFYACARHVLRAVLALLIFVPGISFAQNADFNVPINLSPLPPNPNPIYPGQTTTLRLALTNNQLNTNGGSALTNVATNPSITLPSGSSAALVIDGTPVLAADSDPACSGESFGSTGGSTFELSGLTVPVRQDGVPGTGVCFIDIPVTAQSFDGTALSVNLTIVAEAFTSDQGTNATGGSQAITLIASQRAEITKSFDSGAIAILNGDPINLTIELENPDSNVTLTGASFTDTFPTSGVAGAIIEPVGTANGSCLASGGGTGTFAFNAGAAADITVSAVTLNPGASCTVVIPVIARTTDGDFSVTGTNTINPGDFSSNEGLPPGSAATANVTARSPLTVSKSRAGGVPSVIASGEAGTFDIVLSNASSNALTNASFTDNPISAGFPGGLSIANLGDVTNSCGGSITLVGGDEGFTASGFDIPGNGSCTVSVTFTGVTQAVDTPITYTNSIPEGAVSVDQPGITSQPASTTITVSDRLRVRKSRSPGTAAPGDAVQYTVTVQNYSGVAIPNVTVFDNLQNDSSLLLNTPYEPSLTAACGSLGVGSAVEGDTDVTFTIPTLPAASGSSPGQCSVTFFAMIDPAATGNTRNIINPGDVCFNGGANCNGGASQNVNVSFRTPTLFEKTFNGVDTLNLLEGIPATMRLEITNQASGPISSTLTFNDALPTGGSAAQQLRVAPVPNIVNTCGGTVTATAGSTSVALNFGSVAGRSGSTNGTCYLEVDVVGPAGNYPNTADAVGDRINADGSVTPISGANPSLQDSATINYTPALAAGKAFTPDEISPGGTSTLVIALENVDATQPISSISVTDPMPSGLLIADPANAYTTCGGPTTVTAVPGSMSASLTGATLAPNSSCALVVDVTGTGSNDWVNSIPVGNITADGGILNSVAVEATLGNITPDDPLIAKNISPGTISPGEASLLTISITGGTQDLTGVQLGDFFTDDGTPGGTETGIEIAPRPQGATTCDSGIVSAQPGGKSVVLTGAKIDAGTSCEITVQITSTSVATLTNIIPQSTLVSDQGTTNSTTFAQSSLSTTSDLGVTKLFSPGVVSANEVSRLTITFLNGDLNGVTNFELTDTYPAGLVNATPSNPLTNCGGGAVVSFPDTGSVRISNGAIGPAINNVAAECTVSVDVVAANLGSYENTIPANTLVVDGVTVPNPPASSTLEVRDRIIVNKAFDGNTLDPGDPNGFTTDVAQALPSEIVPLTIRIENPNDIELTQLQFTDTLPDGLTLALDPNLDTDCTDGTVVGASFGRNLKLTGATLGAAGQSDAICTVTADVLSAVPGLYVNEIPAGDISTFEGIDNNPGTQASVVISETPTVQKEFIPPVASPGSTVQLRIALGNPNDADADLTEDLVDTLPSTPGAMVIAGIPNVDTDCPGGPGIVTASAGANTVTIASGSTIPGPGGCVVTLDVTATDPGDYLNNIPVGALKTTLGTNDTATNAPLKISTLGYISGKVFLDNATVPTGLFVPGNSNPISSNTIELRDGADCTGTLIESAATDASGNYLFDDLPAGTYSVCQTTQFAGSQNSITTEGTIVDLVTGSGTATGTPGTPANPTTTTSQITGIVLGSNADPGEVAGSPNNNFSEVLPASLSGNVYHDVSNDGIFDAGETPLEGVTITLTGTTAGGDPVTASTTTAADGSWSFTNLFPGTYAVTETQPAGWDDGIDTRGTVDGVAVGDDSTSDVISAIVLGPGDAGVNYNFGEVLPGTLLGSANAYCLNDTALVDYQVTSFSGSSAPLVTLTFTAPDNTVVEQRTNQPITGTVLWPGMQVDSSNNPVAWPGYEFTAGAWRVVPDNRRPDLTLTIEVNPSTSFSLSYPPATPACTAAPSGSASLSGNVYHDESDDGLFDPSEDGIAGVTITLTGPVTATTTTAADGSWSFTGLPDGTYTVTETQPAGWTDGQDTRGTVDTIAGGDDSVNDVISGIVLAPGNAGVDYNFGELLPADLANSTAVAACRNNAIFVDYSVGDLAGPSAPPVTIRWNQPGGGSQVEELTGQDGSGSVPWPGTVLDGGGNPTDWPGYEFVDNRWQKVDDGLLPDLTFTLVIDSLSEPFELTYPESTIECAGSPPGTRPLPASIPAIPFWLLTLMTILTGALGLRRLHVSQNGMSV